MSQNENLINNQMYYNQIKKTHRKKRKTKSFGSKDIILDPQRYKTIFLFIYFLIIPYLAGVVFLFFFIAGADYNNFMLLNMTSVFIVWAIGYEIVATIALLVIYIMFLSS